MMCSAPVVIVMLCFLCYVRLFCLMFYVFYIRYFVMKKERMHVTSFIFIDCVCINRSVFAGAVGDGGSWFKFLSLLAKAVSNNNQL